MFYVAYQMHIGCFFPPLNKCMLGGLLAGYWLTIFEALSACIKITCVLYILGIFQSSESSRRSPNLRGLNGSGNKVRPFHWKRHIQAQTGFLFPFQRLLTSPSLPTGPHFVEYLGFTVTEECNVLLKCQVRTAALCPSLKVQRVEFSGI